MRILHVTGSMQSTVGGPSQGIRNLVPELARQGIQSEVVCVDDAGSVSFSEDPFTIHVLGPGITPWCYSEALPAWLKYNLARFDLVIIHGSWLYPGFAAYQAWKEMKEGNNWHKRIIKLYCMPHGMLDPYFQSAPGRGLKALRNWIYWKLIEGRICNEADGLLFTCREELALARTSFKPYKPKTELNTGFGIPQPPVFKAAMRQAFETQFPALRGTPYFLFLSRIHPKKGVEILLQAYLRLKESNPSLPKLVIAGPGMETEYGRSAEWFVSSRGLENDVIFTGMLSGDIKWAAFYGCEAYILPSHQENFGIAIVEAMACGRPVIISDKVNIWREIRDSGAGLVGHDSFEGLLESWSAFLDMPVVEKENMAAAARVAFEDQFSVQSAISQLLKCLSGIQENA